VHGDLREIAGYLTAEVLERQADDLNEFLLHTSILDRLCPGLCQAVTGRDDAHLFLERLAGENLFVTALDDRDEWHRYHHLFQELLRAQLERRRAASVPDLHRRAAAWYRDHDDPERAVRHACFAGDADSVVVLAAQTCDAFVMVGQGERGRQLLECFSDEQIGDRPALIMAAAQLATYHADARLQRWARHAEAMEMDDGPSPVGNASMRSWQAVTRAARASDGLTHMYEDATLACELEKLGDPAWLCTAETVLSVALYLSGRVQRAQEALEQTARSAKATGDDADEVWVLGMQALIAADQGRWGDAAELDRQIDELSVTAAQVPPMLAHALVLAHADDPGLAAFLAEAERDAREIALMTSGWRMILRADVFDEIALRQGDDAAAERWAAEAEAELKRYPDAGILRGRTERLRAALEQRRMTDPITPAERRVLELLPTQLTAEQIAVRLFVSRNTVKSHLKGIYSKLGVTTRTDAVVCARRLGLVKSRD
jgi:LuxR family maltose regulon positive regulatory protein